MKSKIGFLVYLITLLMLQSCSSKKQIPNTYLRKVKSISSAVTLKGDSTFFTPFAQIKQYNNLIYASDTRDNRMIVFDTLMNIKRIIGSTGSGPGEFKYCNAFDIYHDSLFIYDAGNKRMEVFDINGNYSRSFILEKNINIIYKFCIGGNGLLYITTPYLNKPISVFNRSGKIIDQFGIWVNAKNEMLKISKNYRSLVILDNKLISVLVSIPTVEIYSLQGELINKIDLSKFTGIFNERLEHIKEEIKDNSNRPGRIIYSLINDINTSNNFLYLQYNTQLTEKHVNVNQILVIEFSGNNVDIVKNLILTKNINDYYWSGAFCNASNFIFSYDLLTGTFNKFKIEGQ
jgi:hypothetical protein